MSSTYKGYRFPRQIISHCVWLYHQLDSTAHRTDSPSSPTSTTVPGLLRARFRAKDRFFRPARGCQDAFRPLVISEPLIDTDVSSVHSGGIHHLAAQIGDEPVSAEAGM